jgi:hypothetical protein
MSKLAKHILLMLELGHSTQILFEPTRLTAILRVAGIGCTKNHVRRAVRKYLVDIYRIYSLNAEEDFNLIFSWNYRHFNASKKLVFFFDCKTALLTLRWREELRCLPKLHTRHLLANIAD